MLPVTSFFDLFAGVGGFRLGLERAGWRCTGWCEIDKWCQRVYRHRWPDGGWFWPDARTLDPSAMPDFDFLVGGPPCQAFSIAGKRKGFEDSRGTLWYDCFRILEAKKPRGFIFENVKGLVCRPFRDREFRRILEILRGLGYTVFWRVLNSKDFGVPQNRERVFIVGFRWEGPAPADFPWPEPRPLTVRLADVLEREVPERYYLSQKTVERIRERMGRDPLAKLRVGGDVATALDAHCWKGPDNHGARTLVRGGSIYPDGADAGRVYSAGGLARSLKGSAGGLGGKTGLYAVLEDFYLGRVRALRRLTPRECERLQGFPDDFSRWGVDEEGNVVEVPDTHRYRMMGNAVSVPVVEALGRAINAYIRVLWGSAKTARPTAPSGGGRGSGSPRGWRACWRPAGWRRR